MPLETPSFTASGNIYPARFVDLSGRHTVAQSAAGSDPIGISQEGTETAAIPGASAYAASSGGSLRVYGQNECCQLEAGASFSVNAKLRPDANGKGVACVGNEPYYAIALRAAAAAGEKVPVFIVHRAPALGSAAVAAAGSVQGDAAALTNNTLNIVSAADGTKGVILPTVLGAGAVCYVYSSVATNGLKIYPITGGAINGGSANAAITIEGKTLAVLVSTSTTDWAAMYTVNT